MTAKNLTADMAQMGVKRGPSGASIRRIVTPNGVSIEATVPGSVSPVGHVELRRKSPGQMEMVNLRVDVAQRRQRVGSKLIDEAVRWAHKENVQQVILEARSSSDGVQQIALVAMYQRMGFSQKGFSPRGTPLMTRQLGVSSVHPMIPPPASSGPSQPQLNVNPITCSGHSSYARIGPGIPAVQAKGTAPEVRGVQMSNMLRGGVPAGAPPVYRPAPASTQPMVARTGLTCVLATAPPVYCPPKPGTVQPKVKSGAHLTPPVGVAPTWRSQLVQPKATTRLPPPIGQPQRIGVVQAAQMSEEVFTDSESDSDDPTHSGVRLTQGKADAAEFDRVRIRRKKIYEDKLAQFDQSQVPEQHRKSQESLIGVWKDKQLLGKVRNKLRAIEAIDEHSGVRAVPESLQMENGVLLQWLTGTRQFKIVVSSDIDALKEAINEAVITLRGEFPNWKITAKMGDPKAKEDHENMHKK
jgi:GNAT superfamily N-acetyltransferase